MAADGQLARVRPPQNVSRGGGARVDTAEPGPGSLCLPTAVLSLWIRPWGCPHRVHRARSDRAWGPCPLPPRGTGRPGLGGKSLSAASWGHFGHGTALG